MILKPIYSILLLALLFGYSGCSSSRKATTASRPTTPGTSYAGLSTERKAVVYEAKRWIGTPYRYGGTGRDGVDCSGFVSRMYAKAGFTLPRTERDMYYSGSAVSLQKARPGDLVFFQNTAGRGITHVGIYMGREEFIHASTARGVITSTLRDGYYHQHFAGLRKVLK